MHVVGLVHLHFLVAPLPPGFVERRRNIYPNSHIRTITPPPQHIIQTPAVDYTDSTTYLEMLVRLTGRQFWGYDHGILIYMVQVVWRCFGIELSGWEFESHVQQDFPWLFHGPVFQS
ncbi:unnamed protein product [Camellia sinensis]